MYSEICHIEFEVTDLARSRTFYEGLFGWKFSDFAIPDMMVFGSEEKHIGGLMRVDKVTPGQSPTIWFRVKNVEESVQRAQSLGGTMTSPKSEVPNVGWSATITDLDGNTVGFVQFTEDA